MGGLCSTNYYRNYLATPSLLTDWFTEYERGEIPDVFTDPDFPSILKEAGRVGWIGIPSIHGDIRSPFRIYLSRPDHLQSLVCHLGTHLRIFLQSRLWCSDYRQLPEVERLLTRTVPPRYLDSSYHLDKNGSYCLAESPVYRAHRELRREVNISLRELPNWFQYILEGDDDGYVKQVRTLSRYPPLNYRWERRNLQQWLEEQDMRASLRLYRSIHPALDRVRRESEGGVIVSRQGWIEPPRQSSLPTGLVSREFDFTA